MMVLDTVCDDILNRGLLRFVYSLSHNIYHCRFRDENSMTTGGKGMEDGSLDASKTE